MTAGAQAKARSQAADVRQLVAERHRPLARGQRASARSAGSSTVGRNRPNTCGVSMSSETRTAACGAGRGAPARRRPRRRSRRARVRRRRPGVAAASSRARGGRTAHRRRGPRAQRAACASRTGGVRAAAVDARAGSRVVGTNGCSRGGRRTPSGHAGGDLRRDARQRLPRRGVAAIGPPRVQRCTGAAAAGRQSRRVPCVRHLQRQRRQRRQANQRGDGDEPPDRAARRRRAATGAGGRRATRRRPSARWPPTPTPGGRRWLRSARWRRITTTSSAVLEARDQLLEFGQLLVRDLVGSRRGR